MVCSRGRRCIAAIYIIARERGVGKPCCDFGAVGWDLLPGLYVAVTYTEPDADEMINVFRAPAPDLRVIEAGRAASDLSCQSRTSARRR